MSVYNFAWNTTHPFLLGAMASFDKNGRVVVYAVAAQMLGLATGPAVSSSIGRGCLCQCGSDGYYFVRDFFL